MGDQVIVTTALFYKDPSGKDKVRFDLACELVELARQAGHVVVVVDGSPVPEVREKLVKLGAKVCREEVPGIGPSRRQSWREGIEFIRDSTAGLFWTEEKPDVIRFIPEMLATMRERKASALIPLRSEASLQTYPGFQRESEQAANFVYNQLFGWPSVGAPYDPMFGPVLFAVHEAWRWANFFAERGVPDTYIQHFIPLFMRRDGLAVASLEVDFVYPPAQRAEEEGALGPAMIEKRLWQMRSLIEAYFTLKRRLGDLPC